MAVSCSTATYTTSSINALLSLKLQGNTIYDHLDLKFESNQDEMDSMDEAEEQIHDINDQFDLRLSVCM